MPRENVCRLIYLFFSALIFSFNVEAKNSKPYQNCDVYFENNSSYLSPEAILVLNDLVYDFKFHSSGTILINGFADRIGSAKYNMTLSKRRAMVVSIFLKRKLSSSKYGFILHWHGEENLPFPTKDGIPEPYNRCVRVSLNPT